MDLRSLPLSAGAARCTTRRSARWSAALALSLLAALPARAADGCLVMLCLAAPSWSSIPQCVDPVHQLLRDLARGRPFPSCQGSDGSTAASNEWSDPPRFCPPQYTIAQAQEGATTYSCAYQGAIAVEVNGGLWARTWWNFTGDSVTEFTPAAKAAMRSWDTRFDDDYARWLATQLLPPPCLSCQ